MTSKRKDVPRSKERVSKQNKSAPKQRKASKSKFVIQGISIARDLQGLQHGFYFKRKELWYLCTQSARPIAKFESLDALQEWWNSFLVMTKKTYSEVAPLKMPEKKKEQREMRKKIKSTNFASVKLVRSKTRLTSPRAADVPSITPDTGKISTTKPAPDRIHWNNEYDMPEF